MSDGHPTFCLNSALKAKAGAIPQMSQLTLLGRVLPFKVLTKYFPSAKRTINAPRSANLSSSILVLVGLQEVLEKGGNGEGAGTAGNGRDVFDNRFYFFEIYITL